MIPRTSDVINVAIHGGIGGRTLRPEPTRPSDGCLEPDMWWAPAPDFPGALCAGLDPELWFPEGNSPTIRWAKGICRECPHEAECYEYALGNPDVAGIWGGTTAAQRDRLRAEEVAA